MRPTVVLLTSINDHQELVRRLRAAGSYGENDLFDHLDQGSCRFGVDVSGEVMREFEEEEISAISEKLGEFSSILIEYPDMPCLRGLLTGVLHGLRGILDTNYGELLRYEEVLEGFRNELWDWRSSDVRIKSDDA